MVNDEYIVIRHNNKTTFENDVIAYLESGFKPVGGISTDSYGTYLQAMVKYGKDKKSKRKPKSGKWGI